MLEKNTHSHRYRYRSIEVMVTLFFMCLFFVVCVSAMPMRVKADTLSDLRSSVSSLQNQIKALDQEIRDYNTKIEKTQGESKSLKAALLALENRKKGLLLQIDSTNLKIKEASKSIDYTKEKIGVMVEIIDKNKSGLKEIFSHLQTDEANTYPFFLMTSKEGSISSFFDGLQRTKEISSSVENKVQDLNDAKKNLEESKREFEIQKSSLQKLQATLVNQKYVVDQNTEEKNRLLTETKNKESNYQQMLAEKKKKKTDLEKEVLDYEDKIKVTIDVSKLPQYGSGVLSYPVDKVIITQYFGNTEFSKKNPQAYKGAGHNGVDFAARTGTEVKAAQSGVIVGTGDTDAACRGVSYGRWVLIKHNNGLTTLYGHLSKILVNAGQKVALGEVVALSGNTGFSTGPHLHFTVYASDAVHVTAPGEYRSKVCGTELIFPVSPRGGYLNPLSYL